MYKIKINYAIKNLGMNLKMITFYSNKAGKKIKNNFFYMLKKDYVRHIYMNSLRRY